jgi:LPS export ABC transporter protein LptC
MSYFKSRNLLLVLALGLALILLSVIVMRYRPESQLQTLAKSLPEGIDVSLQDIDYTHIENGKPQWRLVAQQVERQSESGALDLVRPQLSFYNEQGEPEGSMQAGIGEVSDDYLQVRLREDVVLKNTAGYTLYTDQLDYDHATQVATTDEHVRLIGDKVNLEGVGLQFYVKSKFLRLEKQVKGTFDSKRRE